MAAGLAWEHEFDGKVDAHYQDAALKTWDMGNYEGVAGRITGRYAF